MLQRSTRHVLLWSWWNCGGTLMGLDVADVMLCQLSQLSVLIDGFMGSVIR
jgi:hypothetical protein